MTISYETIEKLAASLKKQQTKLFAERALDYLTNKGDYIDYSDINAEKKCELIMLVSQYLKNNGGQ